LTSFPSVGNNHASTPAKNETKLRGWYRKKRPNIEPNRSDPVQPGAAAAFIPEIDSDKHFAFLLACFTLIGH
jgi:hypothetical protein